MSQNSSILVIPATLRTYLRRAEGNQLIASFKGAIEQMTEEYVSTEPANEAMRVRINFMKQLVVELEK